MPEFNPAMPKQGKWSVGENRFDEEGKNPKQLTIFIPEESIDSFCRYVQSLRSKVKPGKVYNYQTKENEDAQGIYLNFKGKQGGDGAFGNINPANNNASIPF